MKQKLLFQLITLSVLFLSCSDNTDIAEVIDKNRENASLAHAKELFIDLKEAETIANQFMNWNQGVNTRGTENSIQTTSVIQSNEINKDTLMYVFNYADGFTIVSATKGVFPILAYSDKGFFDENDTVNIGPSIWLNYMKESIAENLKDPEVDLNCLSDYNLLKKVFEEKQKAEIVTKAQYYDEIRNYQKVGPLVTTDWHQGPPYNMNTPIIDGVKAPAGCVPIAISQVINYHRKFSSSRVDWAGIDRKNNTAIAGLIHTISQGIEMTYQKTYAHPTLGFPNLFSYRDRIVDYLNSYGYYTRFTDPGNVRPVTCPAIYEAFQDNFIGTTDWFKCHWWVMDGYESYDVYRGWGEMPITRSGQEGEFISYSVLLLHFNWGWESKPSGWYGVAGSYEGYSKHFKRLEITKL